MQKQADDDEDGLTDYPNDPGCLSMEDRSEDDNGAVPVCANQTDDDGRLTDFPADPGCLSASAESEEDICGDSVRISEYPSNASFILGSTGSAEA